MNEPKLKSAGDNILVQNSAWTFSGTVAESFDAHVSKSVPLYDIGHELVVRLSDFFLSDDSTCYELGCSTGTLTDKLATHNAGKRVRYIAVDCVPEMLAKAREKTRGAKNIVVEEADLRLLDFEPADMIVSYYTLQFVAPKYRQQVFDRIYNALNWGGAFVLFEKVRAPDARFQDIMTALYTDYKIAQGYDSEEIVSKTRSLKGVLEPFSTQGNLDLLKRAGFEDVTTVFKYVSFEGFLAIK